MAENFYQDMQDTASGILDEFAQGSLQLEQKISPDDVDPDRPWAPVPAPVTGVWQLSGAMRTVDRRFVDGTLVVATDSQATVAVRARRLNQDPEPVEEITPQMGALLVVDGESRVIKKIVRIPEAGTVVAWVLVVAS